MISESGGIKSFITNKNVWSFAPNTPSWRGAQLKKAQLGNLLSNVYVFLLLLHVN
jgi:hypothetical protein